jgi:hypothetical protein
VVSVCNDECSKCDEYNGGNKGQDLSLPLLVGSVSDVDAPPRPFPPLTPSPLTDDKSVKLVKYHKPD